MNAQCFVWDQNERSLRETGKNQVQKERGGISQGVICVGTKGTEPAWQGIVWLLRAYVDSRKH